MNELFTAYIKLGWGRVSWTVTPFLFENRPKIKDFGKIFLDTMISFWIFCVFRITVEWVWTRYITLLISQVNCGTWFCKKKNTNFLWKRKKLKHTRLEYKGPSFFQMIRKIMTQIRFFIWGQKYLKIIFFQVQRISCLTLIKTITFLSFFFLSHKIKLIYVFQNIK